MTTLVYSNLIVIYYIDEKVHLLYVKNYSHNPKFVVNYQIIINKKTKVKSKSILLKKIHHHLQLIATIIV